MGIAAPSVRRGLWIVGIALLLRLIAAITGPLIDDEAYYWVWSRALDWGYLDHPPLIAYLIFLTTRLGDAPLLIRLAPLVLGAATSLALFFLGREMFGVRAGVIAAVLYQIVPVLAGAGLLATPDAPLFFAWTLALRFAWQAQHGRPRRWLGAGAAVGFGLLSKLSMVLLPAGLALYLLLWSRRWLRRPEPYAGLLLAAVLFSPVLYWNARHDWAGVRFLLVERLGKAPTGLTGILKLAEEQPAFVLTLLIAFIWALIVALRRRDERFAFLSWTSLPVLVAPFIPAYAGGWPHGNWLGPGYLGLTVVVGALWNRTMAVLAVVNGIAVAYALSASSLPMLPLPPGAEEVYGWREAGARVTMELARPRGPAVIVADRYQVAAQLAYHARPAAATLLPCPPAASVWPPVEAFRGRDALAVIDARWRPVVRWEEHAAAVEDLAPLAIELRGRPLRTFRFYRLDDLTPATPCPFR